MRILALIFLTLFGGLTAAEIVTERGQYTLKQPGLTGYYTSAATVPAQAEHSPLCSVYEQREVNITEGTTLSFMFKAIKGNTGYWPAGSTLLWLDIQPKDHPGAISFAARPTPLGIQMGSFDPLWMYAFGADHRVTATFKASSVYIEVFGAYDDLGKPGGDIAVGEEHPFTPGVHKVTIHVQSCDKVADGQTQPQQFWAGFKSVTIGK